MTAIGIQMMKAENVEENECCRLGLSAIGIFSNGKMANGEENECFQSEPRKWQLKQKSNGLKGK